MTIALSPVLPMTRPVWRNPAGIVPAGLTPITSFDHATARFSDAGITPAADGARVALHQGTNGYTMSEHDADQGMIARAGYLEGDGATTAMILDGMGPRLMQGGFMLVTDITPDDTSNRVLFTLDSNPESQRARWFLTGTDRLRLDLNGASTDVTIGAVAGQRYTLAVALADDLASVWVDGVLAAENIPFALSGLTIPNPRATLWADINGATDERFEFNGKAYRTTLWDLT